MRCEVEGLSDIISDLAKLADDSEDIADEMLDAAAVAMEESWRDEIERRGFVDTGQMKKSVTSKINKKHRRVDTYPTGEAEYHSKNSSWKTSNAAKAFILHHGRDSGTGMGAIKATYFVNDVLEEGGIKAQIAMRDVLSKHLKKKGL